MSKLMCSEGRSVYTGALEAMPNNRSDATCATKTADRSFSSQEYAPTGALWSSTSQISGYRFAHFAVKGSSLRWPVLPQTLNCPAFQSISPSSRDATSPERKPSRASKSAMA